MISLNQRVKVKIADRNEYAVGAVESLDGLVGMVAAVGPVRGTVQTFLVQFDTPARPWGSTHQSPVRAFWFEPKDLKEES